MRTGTMKDDGGAEWHYEAISPSAVLVWQTSGMYNESSKLEYRRSTVEMNAGNFAFWKRLLSALDNYSPVLIINTN